jgi:glycosyltransferase involved in cell wall biosynthesis
MLSQLEMSVILTTYERPAHLERSLMSLTKQHGVAGKFEVIVSDDGSTDRTQSVVRRFARIADFLIKWVSHPHNGFRVALCRNDGVRASRGPYLLFTDSDCIFPADHLQKHLVARRRGIIRAGDCFRLDQESTERIDEDAIASGEYGAWVSREERQRLFQKKIKEQYYQFVRHPTKPKLTGYNIGMFREDFEAVNGFDASFVGWGCEDDDLAFRLRKAGRRIVSALPYTHGYHLWHPAEPSRPAKWTDGPNVCRLANVDRPVKCKAGLVSMASDIDEAKRRTPHLSKRAA